MESFYSTLMTELIHRHTWATRAQARQAIFEFIEVFYNRQRLHSSLGYRNPTEEGQLHDFDAFRTEDVIEADGELGVAVSVMG